MIHSDSLTRKVLDYVRAHPGTTRPNMLNVLPDETKPRSVSTALYQLAKGGVIENRGRAGRSARWYPIDISVKAYYRKIARTLLDELKNIHHSQREDYLAKRLQEIFDSSQN